MHTIARGIYYEDSYLGVTLGGLVFSHGAIMIDAPLRSEDTRSWRSTLLNQRSGTNRLLVNLDAHIDRTLGARALDCTIVAHYKTALAFRTRSTIFKGQSVESGAAWELYNDAIGMRWAPPDITFTDRMSLFWGGPEVLLEHRPGPTSGAIWVTIPAEKVVFVGDAVVNGQPPFLANAELGEWVSSLDALLASYPDFTIISGRGGRVNHEDIDVQRQFIQEAERKLDSLEKHNAPPEATEELVSGLLALLPDPGERKGVFEQRLRYGLFNYIARRYHSLEIIEPVDHIEDIES